VRPFKKNGALIYGLRGNAYYTEDIAEIETLPPETNLGYEFKQPPTIVGDDKEGGGQADETVEKTADPQAPESEQEDAEEAADRGVWYKIDVGAELTLLGGTLLPDGGYVLAGINGVLWESDNPDATVHLLPNTRDGGLAGVTLTRDGNLIAVGENGAFLYQRDQ